MSANDPGELLWPALREISKRATIAGRFIDKDLYRINIATLWANLVLSPEDIGLGQGDLESVHDFINSEIARQIGDQETLSSCFGFLNSRSGERAMTECRVGEQHRQMLLYFASMILDPDGHRRWMDQVRDRLNQKDS